MKRKGCTVRFLVCLLALMLAAPCVRADLFFGSKGEDVRQLQSMLIDLGFLNDKADGIFGNKTQAAVEAIQRYWCVDETGIADEGVINDLEILWNMAMGHAQESGAPINEQSDPPFCFDMSDGEGMAVYCWRHADAYPIMLQLYAGNPPDRLAHLLAERVCEIWYSAIRQMYAEWEASLPESERPMVSNCLHIFERELAQRRKAWKEEHGEASAQAVISEMQWLDSVGVEQCFRIYGAEEMADITGSWYADIQGVVATLILYADNSYVFEMDCDVMTGDWTLTGDVLCLDAGSEDELAFAYDEAAQRLTRRDGYGFDRTLTMGWKPEAMCDSAEISDFEGIWSAHHVNYFGPLLPVEDANIYMDMFVLGQRVSVTLNHVDPKTYEGEAAFVGNKLMMTVPQADMHGGSITFEACMLEDGTMAVVTQLPSGPATFYLEKVQMLE